MNAHRYAIGVGSNLGDRAGWIARARSLLQDDGLVRLLAEADLIETLPLGGPGLQGPFLNGCWLVETGLGPHQLLHLCQRVETACGRTRALHWGRRTLDLDLLLRLDGLQVSSGVLQLPHPRLHERAFALGPLREALALLGTFDIAALLPMFRAGSRQA